LSSPFCRFSCRDPNSGYNATVIQNIIFDWSGTLVDDLPAVWKATNRVLARARCPEMTLDQFRAEFCLPFDRFYDRHIPHVPLAQLEAWYFRDFKRIQRSVRELPHARAFLEFCRDRKLRTFLLSSVHADHFAAQALFTGLGALLERPYVAVRDKRRRIRAILEENGLAAGETLFVGDMQHDIETARRGGVHSCAVLTGYNTLKQLRAARPDLIVEHLGELKNLLESDRWPKSSRRPPPAVAQTGAAAAPVPTVGALIFNAAGLVLLVRTHKWSNLWGIPGGKIRWGESATAALRREIREETNLEIRDIRFVMAQDCIRSREFYRDAHFVLLNYTCRSVGRRRVRLNDEAREFRWVSTTEAMTLPLNRPTRRLLRVAAGPPRRNQTGGTQIHVQNQHR
jgi:phosphoglycolate phosphatase